MRGHALSGLCLMLQGDGEFVRIKLTHQETMKSKVLSLKQDLKYWPTWELVLDPATSKWVRRSITSKL